MSASVEVAVVGMALRCGCGIKDLDAFWQLLAEGREAISFFSEAELEDSPFMAVDRSDPHFVAAGSVIGEIDRFDAPFFGISPSEAEVLDPQHRLFLECAWEALEHAGYDITSYPGHVAVYAGSSDSTYLFHVLSTDQLPSRMLQVLLGNRKDHLAPSVSYHLNLTGESINLNTACSTSLVAIHMACQSLLNGQCDLALAGGVSIDVPERTGYLYEEGMTNSPDGHCRTFDRQANGTVFGNGLGVVVLKTLADARRDHDSIYAVIKGSAINNDGRAKVGYTAPSVDGQAQVITMALEFAEVDPATIGYVEAHGTATHLGDPIEIAALTQAYRQYTEATQYCAIGSVKTNVGHLNAAAGVIGFLKAVLALHHRAIPPSLHYAEPNPAIDFASSPFYVNTRLTPWQAGAHPLRAAVSSFGMGGTNAHVILEAAPPREDGVREAAGRTVHLLTLSARSPAALRAQAVQYAAYCRQLPEDLLADVCFTSNVGRAHFEQRLAVAASSTAELAEQLSALVAGQSAPGPATRRANGSHSPPRIAFLCTGQGSQYVGMGEQLYHTQPTFRRLLEQCQQILRPFLPAPLLSYVYPQERAADSFLHETWLTQPALFSIEYSLAQLWLSWGIEPAAILGHSIGEYVGACLAGAFSLEDGLRLVAERGRLMQSMMQEGRMAAIMAGPEEIAPLLEPYADTVAIAAVNGWHNTVISGAGAAVQDLVAHLRSAGKKVSLLPVSRAFHSPLVEPMLTAFGAVLQTIDLRPLNIPLASNVTGELHARGTLLDSEYWLRHTRQPVQFAKGIRALEAAGCTVFIEIGPQPQLLRMAQSVVTQPERDWLPSLERGSEAWFSLLQSVGTLYVRGARLALSELERADTRWRVPVPLYPFERHRYWVAGPGQNHGLLAPRSQASSSPEMVRSLPPEGPQPDPAPGVAAQVQAIWQEILRVSSAGGEENFFLAGGDSLSAVQLLSRCRQILRVEVPLRHFFADPSLSGLIGLVGRLTASQGHPVGPGIVPVPRTPFLPLSFAQQRLWFLDQLVPGNPFYNIPAAVRFKGHLQIAALARSLQEIVRRHEVLRTTFQAHDGRASQVIAAALHLHFPLIDLRRLPPQACEAQATHLAIQEFAQPFDLWRGPLLRTALLLLAEQESVLLLTVHHSISDNWSMSVFTRELAPLYTAYSAQRVSPLSELPIQYADFAAWQRAWLSGPVLASQLAYWEQQLQGPLPVLDLPTDYPRPPIQHFRGASQEIHCPAALSARLRAIAQAENATLFMLLLAAFAVLLSCYTGQEDLIIGSPIANRTQREIEDLIGFFVNTLALRIDLSGRPAFREVLQRVRAVTLAAYEHQDIPFELLVEKLQPERNLDRNPLFQVALAFQNTPFVDMRLPDLTLEPFAFADTTTRFDLELYLRDEAEGIAGTLQYSTDLFAPATIARLLAHFQILLTAIASAPDQPISALSIVTGAEHEQIVSAWNATERAISPERCIHDLFAQQVARRPEAVAVLAEDSTLSYRALETRANQLAHHLRRLGLQEGAPVAIALERSAQMTVALLGVLKAGASYVPLDIDWPSERQLRVLTSLHISTVLTCASQLRALQELAWSDQELTHLVCLDVPQPEPSPQPLDLAAVQAFWDHLAETAVDRISAAGFLRSSGGAPFSEAEVDAYRDHVVALARPYTGRACRVLEIGCGSGLLLFALAPHVQYYLGLDSSPPTQRRNRAEILQAGYQHVELLTGFAHELESLVTGSFDLIILASTIQFFPDYLYLDQVLRAALAHLNAGGALIVADVPDPQQREHMLSNAARLPQDGAERARQAGEHLLFVPAAFFSEFQAAHPALGRMRVLDRQGVFANELRTRYDVVFEQVPGPTHQAGDRPGGRRMWTAWDLAQCPSFPPPAQVTPEHSAYILHTSGSTGQPKGVVVQHRAVVNLIDWVNTTFEVGPADCVLFVTSLCFDLSVYDIFGPLAGGGSLCVASRADVRDPERLCALLARQHITFWDSAPAVLQRLLPFFASTGERTWEYPLRLVFLSGDWIPLTLPAAIAEVCPRAQVVSLGGATEATIWSNVYPIQQVDPRWVSIPYGKPIQNAHYYILDAHLRPCPIGVPGDLYIGGACLARGYVDPVQTAERFLPHPLSRTAGQRLYATGDRARYWPDGVIEFLGRLDNQVKIRGFRIELGEIETTLLRHPAVREAVVLARDDRHLGKQLVAYIVAQPADASSQDDLVASWHLVFDEQYRQPLPPQPDGLNIAGWHSSYTNEPFALEEMREWVELAVSRLLALRPEHVLEIGCGSGLLLLRLAPHCASYRGTDLSQAALAALGRQIGLAGGDFSGVTLSQQAADSFSDLPLGAYDTIILNSVVQYFPDCAYLVRVLAGALPLVAPGGRIFIGDVRNLAHLETFHASVQYARSSPTTERTLLRQRIRQQMQQERELLIDPTFFVELQQHFPLISRVEIHHKGGRFANEMTQFRYDVIVHIGGDWPQLEPAFTLDWREHRYSLAELETYLSLAEAASVLVQQIPNPHFVGEVSVLNWLAEETGAARVGDFQVGGPSVSQAGGIKPEALCSLSETTPYLLERDLSCQRDGAYSALFRRRAATCSAPVPVQTGSDLSGVGVWETCAHLTNCPQQVASTQALFSRLRAFLRHALPEYMLPSAYVLLPTLPLTPNGKLDRQALPLPERELGGSEETGGVRTPTEELLAAIWCDILGREHVGITDNFFESGGDSILSIQVITRARQAGFKLSPQQVFQYQTIAELAQVVDTAPTVQAEQGPVIAGLPLTPILHWFFEQDLPEPQHWNTGILLEVRQELRYPLLRTVIAHLLSHHDALRLRFRQSASGWQAATAGLDADLPLTYIDLSAIPPAEQPASCEQVADALQRSLHLSEGPLLRVALFKRGAPEHDRLLIIIHHLAVDALSWRILIEDLQESYRQLCAGQQLRPPEKTTSFHAWATRLERYAQSSALEQEYDYWRTEVQGYTRRLPLDRPGGVLSEASIENVACMLSAAETQDLLQRVPQRFQTRINDVLMLALAQTCAPWIGSQSILLNLESHGRATLFEDVDISRTVGWFTSLFPLRLHAGDPEQIEQALQGVRDQLQRIPHLGIGYGLLRYLNQHAERRQRLASLPQAEITFNYMGQLDRILEETFVPLPESIGVERSLSGKWRSLLEISASISGGQLCVVWSYGREIHLRSTIEKLAETYMAILRRVIARCAPTESRLAADDHMGQ